jgi:hypothetical protein
MWKNSWKRKMRLNQFENETRGTMPSRKNIFALALMILTLSALGLLMSCSKEEDNPAGPVPTSNTLTIYPPLGGTVAFGSAEVSIPPNALTDTTDVTVALAPDAPNYTIPPNTAQVGQIYAFTPEGLTFDIPVAITMQYTNWELGSHNENTLTLLTYSDAGATPVAISNITRDPDNNKVSGTTTHFSYFMIGATSP